MTQNKQYIQHKN